MSFSFCRLVKAFYLSNHSCAMADHQVALAEEGGGNATVLSVLSLLPGVFAAWCQRPVVITRLCLS